VARFDLHRARGAQGYLLNVQHDLHDRLSTRVVVPVLPQDDGPLPSSGLNPRIEIGGVPHHLFPQYMAAVPKRDLGRVVGNLEAERDAITKALDVLLMGF
jgi:toxin CcdB